MVDRKKRDYTNNRRDFSILIIDDDPVVTRTITKILQASNPSYYIATAGAVQPAIDLAAQTNWDTILLDLSLPWKPGGITTPEHGLKAMKILKEELQISSPVIAITGSEDSEELSDLVLDAGAYYFLTKPLRAKSLCAIVHNATNFQMTGFDGLTGLLNKITFEERLKSEFERVRRKNNECITHGKKRSSISLIFMDGDNFKLVNDTYNHLVGDQVLKAIGNSFVDESLYKALCSSKEPVKYIIRPYDIAARFGGDEFSIFLPETDHENALSVARRIRSLIEGLRIADIVGPDQVKSPVEGVSLSMGIATYPEPNRAACYEELIFHADRAMYESKKLKEGGIFGYRPDGTLVRMD